MLRQELFYPLIDNFDKSFFTSLQKAVKDKYTFMWDLDEKIFFLKWLLCFQMLKDYRTPLYAIKDNLGENTDIKVINDIIKSKAFTIDYSWAVWNRDKDMGELVKRIFNSPLDIIGTNGEFNEFVLRYLISIWLVDWEWPLYALLQLTKGGEANLDKMNKILSLWDFTKIFASYKK